jgi:hypothetical protein
MKFNKKNKLIASILLLFLLAIGVKQYTFSKPLVIIEITGDAGLGNQMFYYAAGYSLAKRLNVEPLLLKNFANNVDHTDSSKRSFGLKSFNLPFNKIIKSWHLNWLKRIGKTVYVTEANFFDVKPGDGDIFIVTKNVVDCFESEIFFEGFKNDLKSLLKYYPPLAENSKLNNTLSQIRNTNSVAIHIRRGDFLGSCIDLGDENRMKYYEQAITLMQKKVPHAKFFVFSDDAKYIREHFNNRQNFVIVSEPGNSSIEEFYLMANCKHMIIANSTYSWWAAYLNRNPKKIIMAPFPKYSMKYYEINPIGKKNIYQAAPYPAEWTRVDSHYADYERYSEY